MDFTLNDLEGQDRVKEHSNNNTEHRKEQIG